MSKPINDSDLNYIESLSDFIELFDNRFRSQATTGYEHAFYLVAESISKLAKLVKEENQALKEEIEKMRDKQ